MNKKQILKGLMILSAFPAIFGFILAKSNIVTLKRTSSLKEFQVVIDTMESYAGSSAGTSTVFAVFKIGNDVNRICIECEGAKLSDYMVGDSIQVWGSGNFRKFYLKDLYPTKQKLKDRYLFSLFIAPAGIMIYPFLIFTFLFFKEKRKQKSNKAKEE